MVFAHSVVCQDDCDASTLADTANGAANDSSYHVCANLVPPRE